MNIFSKLSEIEKTGSQAVICIVTQTKGSTPRHAGSKMVIYPDGSIEGTIGGGELESLCIAESKRLLETGNLKTNTLHYHLVNPDQGDPGVCGGGSGSIFGSGWKKAISNNLWCRSCRKQIIISG